MQAQSNPGMEIERVMNDFDDIALRINAPFEYDTSTDWCYVEKVSVNPTVEWPISFVGNVCNAYGNVSGLKFQIRFDTALRRSKRVALKTPLRRYGAPAIATETSFFFSTAPIRSLAPSFSKLVQSSAAATIRFDVF